jgi:trans-2,3-dihydro-3-hydroxyanthranilate isomerase
VPVIIVPLNTREALTRAQVVKDKYYSFIKNLPVKIFMIFCPEAHKEKHDLSVRVFADYYGVPEDPATGASNGCLGGYLIEHTYFDTESVDLLIDQGYEIGRPSLVRVRAEKRGNRIDIMVGGKVVMVGTGELV